MEPIIKWFMAQEEKEEMARKRNQLHLINSNLQNLLRKLVSEGIEKEAYQDIERKLSRQYGVVQCTLWRLQWANNFERAEVALAQGLLIKRILEDIEDPRLVHYISSELNRWMNQLGLLEPSLIPAFHRGIS